MTRFKRAVAALLLVAVASSARALDPKTLETDWNEKTVSFTTTSVTAATFDIAGFGAAGYAVVGGTYVANGVDGTTLGTVLAVSSATKNVQAFDYFFYANGSTAAVQMTQTIKTPANPVPTNTSAFNNSAPSLMSFAAPVISTSSVIIMPASTLFYKPFRALVGNPVFYLTGLKPSSTYTLTLDYGVPRLQ